MKKNISILLLFMMLVSCAPTNMYYWGNYGQATYQHNKYQSEKTNAELLIVFEDIINKKHKGIRNAVPPGIYADYGFFLIKDGQITKGKEMLEKELFLYPESKKAVEYILNKL